MLKILIFTLLFITASCNHYNDNEINSAWLEYHNEKKTSSNRQITKSKNNKIDSILSEKNNKKNRYKINNGYITVKEGASPIKSQTKYESEEDNLKIISEEAYFSALGVECTRVKYNKGQILSSHVECDEGDRKTTYRDLTY